MTQRIDPVLVEKALTAFWRHYSPTFEEDDDVGMEAAIRAVFDELGLKEERREDIHPSHQALGSWRRERKVRYISDWRPVEQGDADGD